MTLMLQEHPAVTKVLLYHRQAKAMESEKKQEYKILFLYHKSAHPSLSSSKT